MMNGSFVKVSTNLVPLTSFGEIKQTLGVTMIERRNRVNMRTYRLLIVFMLNIGVGGKTDLVFYSFFILLKYKYYLF